jgi:hypothetical protein
VTLVSGEIVVGRLAEVGEDSFSLRVPVDAEARQRITGAKEMTRRINHQEVQTITGGAWSRPEELPHALQTGREVKVTLASGAVVSGRVELFDGDRLEVDGQTWRLSEGDIAIVEARVADSLANGALIGAGVGAGLSLLSLASCGTQCPDNAAALLPLVGIGAGLGVAFDALKKETKIFHVGQTGSSRSLTITPLLTRDQRGVLVTLRF